MWPGFGNAFLMTGDLEWIDTLRRQIELLYAQGKEVNGRFKVPNNHGDDGWYLPREYLFTDELAKIWQWTMDPEDFDRLPKQGWTAFLAGENPSYPEKALRGDLEFIRERVARMKKDPTSPESRLADWPLRHNPITTRAMVKLACGGHRIDQGLDRLFGLLHSRVRYFDPECRRAGLPKDVAALVTEMKPDYLHLTLVNINQLEPRSVVVQGGAYGEHQIRRVNAKGVTKEVDSRFFEVRLSPGAGADLIIHDRRYANQPSLSMPWFRDLSPSRFASR
jgi:hypothetical protein